MQVTRKRPCVSGRSVPAKLETGEQPSPSHTDGNRCSSISRWRHRAIHQFDAGNEREVFVGNGDNTQ